MAEGAPARMDPRGLLQRNLCIFHDSGMNPQRLTSLRDEEVNYATMREVGVHFQSLRAAGLGASDLRGRGFETPRHYRDVGMDALDLCDGTWVRAMVAEYGVEAIKSTYLCGAAEAATLVGSEGGRVLGVGLVEAMELCVGEPEAAFAVLKSHPDMPDALASLEARHLLDAGIRASKLLDIGVGMEQLVASVKPTVAEMRLLGYSGCSVGTSMASAPLW